MACDSGPDGLQLPVKGESFAEIMSRMGGISPPIFLMLPQRPKGAGPKVKAGCSHLLCGANDMLQSAQSLAEAALCHMVMRRL